MKKIFFGIFLLFLFIGKSIAYETADSIRLKQQLDTLSFQMNQINWASQRYYQQQNYQQAFYGLGIGIAALRENIRQNNLVKYIIEYCLDPDGSPKVTWDEFGQIFSAIAQSEPIVAKKLFTKILKSYSESENWAKNAWNSDFPNNCLKKIKEKKDRLDKFTIADTCNKKLANQTSIKVELPDGTVREFASEETVNKAADLISEAAKIPKSETP